jgi:hypothetical protein
MLNKETGKTFLIVLTAIMVGLVVHHKVVAPMLEKKA